jgi:hypothetical protein
MTLEPLGILPPLEEDAYRLEILGFPYSLSRPLLVRGDLEWRYEGVVHEYLTGNGYPPKTAPLLQAWALRAHHTSARMNGKGERYIALLEQHLADHPDDPRSLFYLARIHDENGDWEAATEAYDRRITAGGWDEETFYARYRLGCLLSTHVSFSAGAEELLAAWRMRPGRVEPLRALANAANDVANKYPVPDDVLFVHRDMYASR